jgi:hypothetical protein
MTSAAAVLAKIHPGAAGAKIFGNLHFTRRRLCHPDATGREKSSRFFSIARTISASQTEPEMPGRGLEPLRIAPPDPKSGASANFATLAALMSKVYVQICIIKYHLSV